MRTIFGGLLGLSLAFAVGCSGGEDARYRLSGEALFDGQPIPFGDVLFTPDGSKGNKGPQGIATIHDGRYDTGIDGGKGICGGPTTIRVTGLTAAGGKVICEFEMKADLPRANGAYKVEVPKEGAGKSGGRAKEI